MLSHISFGEGKKTLAILIPTPDFDSALLKKHYIEPLEQHGIPRKNVIAFNLEANDQGKFLVSTTKPHLKQIGKVVKQLRIKDILVCNPNYFKTLCKVSKSDPHYGYPMPTLWPGTMGFICPNYRALFHNPNMQGKIDFSLKAVTSHINRTGGMFDEQILTNCTYPGTDKEIIAALDHMATRPELSCDIEAHSLMVNKAGLATICFAEDQHTGIAFPVGENRTIRHYLKQFFSDYTGKLIFHGSPYDCKVIIWELFMEHPRDISGMLEGLHIMFRNLEDTKILAYLALNSTTRTSLRLKDLAFEYTGNYALDDMENIEQYSLNELLTYNMTDGVGTWYVHDLYRDTVRQQQENIYQEIFLPALKTITQMELCGVPINLGRVLTTEHELDDIARKHYKAIMDNPIIADVTDKLRELQAINANKKLKILVKTADDFLDFNFNPNSHQQLAYLLHKHLDLPVLGYTDTGQPSTKSKTLKALSKRIKNSKKWKGKGYITLIEHIIELHDVTKILTTFIPAFKNNSISKEGWEYLHGSFNLGTVISGRLSSSDPNLTNIPSTGTQYAKPVKECFQTPPHITDDNPYGWLMVGADFRSLEDMVSALQTKDPNKLKIYTDGYDGHCLRAYHYFGDRMPDIDPNSVASINSIEDKYPDLRQLSKSPTFLLTYMGTWKGLMKQFGFTKKMAQRIEANYHKLYAVSDEWVMDRIREAGKTGYLELAFGLRLRTPILPQVVLDSDVIPYQAHKEIKTAGNALGQSYGLLNTRAANEFMQRVWDSRYATKILPCMQIHDSQYYIIENTLGCLKWVNDNLIECMEWNELEPIQHPTIKLGGKLEVYYPNWAKPIKIPNRQSLSQLKELLKDY
jgi:DNA polymerase-1